MAHIVHSGELIQSGRNVGRQVAGFGIGHPDLMGIESEIRHMIRFETKIHGLHRRKTAHKKCRDHQQYQRTGNLQRDQTIAQPMPTDGRAAASLDARQYSHSPWQYEARARC